MNDKNYDNVQVSTSESLAKTQTVASKEMSVSEIKGALDKYKRQLSLLVPKHTEPEQLLAIAIMACQREPKLRKCTMASLVASTLKCAQAGLLPDGEDAAIVPYWNKNLRSYEAQFQAMYQGILKQAYHEEKIESVHAYEARANDEIDISLGQAPSVIHKPRLRDRGELIGAYGVVHLKGAPHPIVEWLDLDDMARIERTAKSDAWKNHRARMFKKSALNAVLKYVPKSKELSMSIALGEMAESGRPQNLAAEIDESYVINDEDPSRETINVTPTEPQEAQEVRRAQKGQTETKTQPQVQTDFSDERRLTQEEIESMGPPSSLTPEEQAELLAAKEKISSHRKTKKGDEQQPAAVGDLLTEK